MRKALALILIAGYVVIGVGGWACLAVIAYRNTSPVVLESCPAVKPLHLPSVRP